MGNKSSINITNKKIDTVMKKNKTGLKRGVILADTRPALIGHMLLQLQATNAGVFDEAIIFHNGISTRDQRIMEGIMPCRFIEYNSGLPDKLQEYERFARFSDLMFARYEMFNMLDEYETLVWTDTDVLILKDLTDLLEKVRETGIGFVREDPENKTADNPDYMRNCFLDWNRTPEDYDMMAWLLCSGLIVLNRNMPRKANYTTWLYKITEEWAPLLNLPDQGALNGLVQHFKLNITPLGQKYCCFPSIARDYTDISIIHAWGGNKFWNDWYLYKRFPEWREYYDKWLALGGSSLDYSFEPAVSIIIPSYKPKLNVFKDCLDVILAQQRTSWERFSNFEVIIVAEPVEHEPLVKFIENINDPRIVLHVNDERKGIAASLNTAMRLARGKYIARMDDDDLVDPYRFYKQMEYLDKHDNIELVSCDFNYFGDMLSHRITAEGELSKALSIFTCPFDHPTIMFRRDFFFDNDLFYDEERGFVEDWELWLRAFDKGMRVGVIHETLFYHRWWNGSAGQNNKTIIAMQALVRKNFARLKVNIPDDLLPSVALWQGGVSQEIYKRLEVLFQQALDNNMRLEKYDQKALWQVFQWRLTEARGGDLSMIAQPIYENQELPGQSQSEHKNKRGFKSLVKRLFKPLYRPVRRRFEEPIYYIGKRTSQIDWQVQQITQQQSRLMKFVEDQQWYNQLLHQVNERQTILGEALGRLETGMQALEREQIVPLREESQRSGEALGRIETGMQALEQNLFQSVTNEMLLGREALDRMEAGYEFWRDLVTKNLGSRKKIFLIGTPNHENIGDAAIAYGTDCFIRRFFPQVVLIEIPTYKLTQYLPFICSVIDRQDMIFLQGGGNFGNRYMLEEQLRRCVVSLFPDNRIVILPQTIWYSEDEKGFEELKQTQHCFETAQDLRIFTRGEQSLEFARKHFGSAARFACPDMALCLSYAPRKPRNGIMVCLRDLNDESGIDQEIYERIIGTVEKIDPEFEITKNLYERCIAQSEREQVIYEHLSRFASHKVVVTDRLHGLIFAVITKTPCIVFKSLDHKIEEYVRFFDNSNAVKYLGTDPTELDNTIRDAMQINNPDYPILRDMDCFYRLAEEIRIDIIDGKQENSGV